MCLGQDTPYREYMDKLPQISQAEYEVMKIVWEYTPISTNQVIEKLAPTSSWNPKTIQTMLLRLVKKGALSKEKEGRVFVYYPLVQKEEYRSNASKNFLNRFYGGALGSMVLNFIQQDQLSDEEIKELRNMLDRKDRKND